MNKIAVAVCDTDREYRDRFVTYLVERKAEEYAVSAFSMPEKLLEALEEEKPDLAICGTGFEEMAERLADMIFRCWSCRRRWQMRLRNR